VEAVIPVTVEHAIYFGSEIPHLAAAYAVSPAQKHVGRGNQIPASFDTLERGILANALPIDSNTRRFDAHAPDNCAVRRQDVIGAPGRIINPAYATSTIS
jgi:hypothetical protein